MVQDDGSWVRLGGSERQPVPGAVRVGPVDPDEDVLVTVVARRRHDERALDPTRLGRQPLVDRVHVGREQFADAHGAETGDLGRIEAFAKEHGLAVVQSDAGRRCVVVSGRAADAGAAFRVTLDRYEHEGYGFRGRTGAVSLPAELEPIVDAVLGLDTRAQARAHFRVADPAAVTASFTPVQVAALYDFPSGLTGKGQCVGIVELGGGYDEADLQAYFERLGLPVPAVAAVSVDGGRNAPTGDPNGADAEVMLDIEVVGAVAPGAEIAVYFAPNTDQGFVDAVTTAVHDGENAPTVISISWGGPESGWTDQARRALDQAFADAAALGVTVCVASGDSGAGDGVGDGRAHVDFPASSAHVLGCGGTRLQANGTTIAAETTWNGGASGGATGGGVSDAFPLPTWQQSAGVPPSVNDDTRVGRGVPDVAGDADPTTGYRVQVDGQQATIGGTSAVAPLWAGLIALLGEQGGKHVGFLDPLLYGLDAGAFRDVTSGDNAVGGTPGYDAGSGWDACTGLGTPNGAALLHALLG